MYYYIEKDKQLLSKEPKLRRQIGIFGYRMVCQPGVKHDQMTDMLNAL